jgi:arylsulfatase A-like enzyme
VENYDKPYVNGFTSSDFLLDPYTYQYLNSAFQRNRSPPTHYAGNYSTDVLASKAYGFIDEAAESNEPFFLVAAPIAPHSNVGPRVNGAPAFTAPISAARHEHLFKDAKVPRTANFNPKEPSGTAWIRKLERQSEENVGYNDEFYRLRLRALQAVDELVEGVIERLEKHGLLNNTYVIYSSGQYSLYLLTTMRS